MSRIRKIAKWLVLGLAALVLIGGVGFFGFAPAYVGQLKNRVLPHEPYAVPDSSRRFHASLTVADLHADSLLWSRDILDRGSYGHVDIPRMLDGNVALQVFTAVIKTPKNLNYESNTDETDNITTLAIAQLWPVASWFSLSERAVYQAGKLARVAERAPDRLLIVRSAGDLRRLLERRRRGEAIVGGVLGIEGAHAFEGKIDNVRRLFDVGHRVVGLAHFFDNEVGGAAAGVTRGGLTDFGRRVVREAENLNLILDLAHASAALIDDVLAATTRPVIVSHTGVKGTCDNNRNLSDNQIRRIAAHGGLIGIGFWKVAVCEPTPAGIVAALRYTADLVGAEHVALGSDFDGAVAVPFDASELSILTHRMLESGFGEDEVRRIMGGNVVDFFLEALPPE